MKVNVVCSDTGWIYDQFIDAFQLYSKHDIVRNSNEECDVTHYIPYYDVPKRNAVQQPCTAWFSHQETKDPLKTKFISAAYLVDHAISHSYKYAKILRQNKVNNVKQIMPGVDLIRFRLREKFPTKKRLVVGYIGRQYTSSARKNPALLTQISQLPFVEFITTGGKLSLDKVPDFYKKLDLVVSPATTEGGPMAVLEALASGVPILCFEGVGVADEFSTGVIKVKGGNQEYLDKIKELYDSGVCRDLYTKLDTMKQMRSQVEQFTWENFARAHDRVWDSVYAYRQDNKG